MSSQSTTRDVSGVRLPHGVEWDLSKQPVVCPHCRRSTPRTRAWFHGRWIAFAPYPCDCEGYKAEVARIERREEERGMRRVEVPERFAETAGRADARSMVAAIKGGRGVYLHGPNGTGKTTMAYAVASALAAEGWRVEVTTLAAIRSDLSDVFATGDAQQAIFRRLAKADLLVLDDLGKESPNPKTAETLYRVVNDRYERRRAVLVTSNFGRGELAARLAEGCDRSTAKAVASRLAEMTESVEMGGADRRRA